MPIRKILAVQVDGPPRGRGRPKRTLMAVVKIYLRSITYMRIWLRINRNGETKLI